MDAEKLAEHTATVVRSFVQRKLAALEQRWMEKYTDLRNACKTDLDARLAEVQPKGDKGDPGIDGKDALEITIHPEMDLTKSYPRGTFVSHLGGLLRSCRKTTPLGEQSGLEAAGWTVVVRGIAEAVVEYPTERTIRNVIRYTDGTETVTEIRSPAVLDRGVFREVSAYERGDGVTFGGSFWIAQKDAPEGKPGTSADWRLAVKKGRDGADR